MRYQAVKRHGGNLSERYQVRGANLKNSHIVRFRLYDIQEKAELQRQYTDQWLQRVGGG